MVLHVDDRIELSRKPDKNSIRNSGNRNRDDHDPFANYTDCYFCTQAGVPVFHSTRYDSDNPNRPPLISAKNQRRSLCRLGLVLDPRSKRVRKWNRAVLLARCMALAVDPLIFNTISINASGAPCFYMNVALAIILSVLRTGADLVHLCQLLLQFRLAYVPSESLVVGCGKLVWDARDISSHYLRHLKGFWLDAFVILPVPQVIFFHCFFFRENIFFTHLTLFL